MTVRTEALAKRIIQGGESLAAFADKLSEEEWNTIVQPDGRRAGVIVHHVASVYPIEIQLAQQVAAGNAIADITWGAVAEMNAKHANDFAAVGKHETVELLKRNSRAAAEAVAALTDEQLDRAMPVSLNGDAPLTAQFVIEDHALRHSWHHLGKIKSALETKTAKAS
jgi:hypothetical protein